MQVEQGQRLLIFGVWRAHGGKIAEENNLRSPVAAEAVGHARQGWLRVAHALDRITTGRLVYADLGRTLTSGPVHQP